jgi:hypothetical protein
MNAMLSDRLRNITTAVWRRHNNQNTGYLPTNSLFRGTEHSVTTVFSFEITQVVTLFGSGGALLPVRPGTGAELPALGAGRRHELPLRRSGAPDRPALDRQLDRKQLTVAIRRAGLDGGSQCLSGSVGFHLQSHSGDTVR